MVNGESAIEESPNRGLLLAPWNFAKSGWQLYWESGPSLNPEWQDTIPDPAPAQEW